MRRVGTIRRVEDVPASKKLMQLIVDCGDHERSEKHEGDRQELQPALSRFSISHR